MNKINLFCLFILIGIIKCAVSGKDKCNMTIHDADECARSIVFIGDRDTNIPTNDGEMSSYCSKMQNAIRCVRNYARLCLPSFPQQVFSMFAYDAKTVMRKQCKSPKERTEFMRHANCFNPKSYMEPLNICVDKYVIQLEVIRNADPAWRIPGVCCTFHQLQECLNKNTASLCTTKTGIETVDYFDDMLNGMTDDVMDFTCGPYKTLEKCDKLMEPKMWQQMKDLINTDDETLLKARHKYKSPMPLLVEIITDYNM